MNDTMTRYLAGVANVMDARFIGQILTSPNQTGSLIVDTSQP